MTEKLSFKMDILMRQKTSWKENGNGTKSQVSFWTKAPNDGIYVEIGETGSMVKDANGETNCW